MVLGAVLLGYVFNFVRLCVLVLFYMVALHFPSLQDRAENADYVIGAALFFVAVYLLYVVIQRLGVEDLRVPAATVPVGQLAAAGRGFFARAAAMAVLAGLGVYGVAAVMRAPGPSAQLRADETALGQFPETVGRYTLARRWNETLLSGALLFHWAEYAPEGGGTHIAIGVSPVLGSHDTLVCHSARGEDPVWHGQETMQTSGAQVSFSTSLFNDGATQYMEATTLCNGSSCGEYANPQAHFGFVYSRPHPETLLSQNPERPIPILLKAETIDTTLPPAVARQQLTGDLTSFLGGVSLDVLTRPYRRQ